MLFDILTKGSYDEVLQVHPISNVLHGHQGSGVLGYASDGAYVNGVAMVSLQLLLFISCRGECPELLAEIRRSLAAVSVKYTRHQSGSKRCASIWTDTATKAALNDPLDPFMMVGALGSTGARIIAPKSGLRLPQAGFQPLRAGMQNTQSGLSRSKSGFSTPAHAGFQPLQAGVPHARQDCATTSQDGRA
jgi:hypothetical protein